MTWNMKSLIPILLTAAVLVGCDEEQRGKWIVMENESGVSGDGQFQYELFYGKKHGEEDASDLLLAVFFLTVEEGNYGASEVENGLYVSKVRRTWDLAEGALSAEIAWNREDDTVVVGSKEYDRSKGNVFLLIPKLPVTESEQLEKIRGKLDPDAVTEELRKLLALAGKDADGDDQ